MKKTKKPVDVELPDWEKLLSTQLLFQSYFPKSVLVGGTAAALHTQHRFSMDADYVLPDLKEKFAKILNDIEKESGWSTKRIEPPVLILGNFKGVRTGIRQLIRSKPLETTLVKGLRIPTLEETLRIKAYLIVRRNTTRDYIDFIALFDHLGVKKSLLALNDLDALYPQPEVSTQVSQQLALQLAEPKPWDLAQTDLSHYKALQAPYSDWKEIKRRAYAVGQKLILERLMRVEE